jgi:hypothetical protein
VAVPPVCLGNLPGLSTGEPPYFGNLVFYIEMVSF